MTLKQLRFICEVSRHRLHLSHAAEMLFVSQPGVSRQIKALEEELGVVLFERKKNRILALTQPGKEILRFAEQALIETENIRNVPGRNKNEMCGSLTIATTHTQARYKLPEVIQRFLERFPDVRMEFWQGNRRAAFQRVDS